MQRRHEIIHRIAKRHRTTKRRAAVWLDECVRYLDLCAEAREVLAPSKKVDKAWHEFVLFTREYAAFCESRYGRFIHHNPHARPNREAYQRTYAAYLARFGRPPARIWPNPFGRGASGCGGGVVGGSGDGGGSCGGGGGGGCGGGGG